MARIQVLDKSVAELIAAGEVVERPASIVKELLENSIDAGADNITVEIQAGGVRCIRISDNGSGILREDIPKAFLRHATSKVRSAEDLDAILTLGFRGEALASVSAVCRVELTTKTAQEQEGTRYRIEGGDCLECSPAGCPQGTTIAVRDIFFNTPARMKFLKKDVAEGNAVAQVVEKCALSHPEVAFRFVRDGQTRLRTSGNGDLRSAIFSVFGREFANDLLEVDYTLEEIRVRGFVCHPRAVKPTRTYQNFFINGRYVRARTCSVALEEAFKTKIMAGKFPSCVLYLEIAPGTVDVNVHPAKIEVRFLNEKPVFNAVFFAVKSALTQIEQPIVAQQAPEPARNKINPLNLHPEQAGVQQTLSAREFRILFADGEEEPSFHKPMRLNSSKLDIYVSDPAEENELAAGPFPPSFGRGRPPGEDSMGVSENGRDTPSHLEESIDSKILPNFAAKTKASPTNKVENSQEAQASEESSRLDPSPAYRYVGQLFATYILLESEEGLLLVDKHAAHERMRYEALRRNLSYGNRQTLLTPLRVSLPQEDYTAVLERGEELAAMGFGVEDFGGAILVREVPIELGERDIPFVLAEIAAKLRDNIQDITPEVLDQLYYSIACKSAIRAGDHSHPAELEELIGRLAENPQITHCPHGRPVSVRLEKKDIEKMFGRLG